MNSEEQLRVIVFKGEFQWVAQCLEHDICVQAEDLETLRIRMEAAIAAELELCRELHGRADLSYVPAAPEKFFEMWERRSAFDAAGGTAGVNYDMAMCGQEFSGMAAAQFGGHPTLAQYIQWLRECGGHANSGYQKVSGKAVQMTKLVTAEGRVALVTGTSQNERMEPTLVARIDRQLQVKSPWHPPIDSP